MAIIPNSSASSAGLNYTISTSLPRAAVESIPSQSVIRFSTPAISTLMSFAIVLPSIDRLAGDIHLIKN